MDPRLLEAVARNDKNTFINLVRENEDFLDQRTAESNNTVLHWASRFGHTELVAEVLKLRPIFVDAENAKLETPVHEACRHGHTEVLKLLLEINHGAACKLSAENQSAFFVACCNGHLDVVKILLNQSWLVGLEDVGLDSTCLHVTASRGFKGEYLVATSCCLVELSFSRYPVWIRDVTDVRKLYRCNFINLHDLI